MPRILVVDDEPNVRRLIQINLERHGYTVETACDGIGAVAALRDRRPDLLIIDRELSGEMSAEQLVSQIRLDPAMKTLPVIYLRTADGYNDGPVLPPWDTCLHLTRPFHPAELLQLVKRTLVTPPEPVLFMPIDI